MLRGLRGPEHGAWKVFPGRVTTRVSVRGSSGVGGIPGRAAALHRNGGEPQRECFQDGQDSCWGVRLG